MKFSVYKSELANALKIAAVAVPGKTITPILSGVYINARDNSIELQTNDNTKAVRVNITANVETDGEIVVDFKRFVGFVKGMPDDAITFSVEENLLILQSGGAAVELLTMTPADFPKIKEITESICNVDLKPSVLKKLITKTVFSVSKDDTRPVFTGVNFQFKGDTLATVATNTHRLAFCPVKLDDQFNDAQFTIPADILRGIANQLDPTGDYSVKIFFAGNRVEFSFDNVFISARLIEGQFPSHERVIPHDTSTHVTANVKEFLRALEFAAIMAKENEYNTVKLSFSGNGIEISAQSDAGGNAGTNVTAQIDGEDLDIAFNVKYLIDVLKVLESETVNIDLGTTNDKTQDSQYCPVKFTAPDDGGYIYVVTPVRAK